MGGMARGPSFGTQIKRARERRHLTQQDLADHLGVDRKTVDNWENDRTTPRNRLGALYEWAPELREDMDPDEAELRAAIGRLIAAKIVDEGSVDVERLAADLRARKRREAAMGGSGRVSRAS